MFMILQKNKIQILGQKYLLKNYPLIYNDQIRIIIRNLYLNLNES
ncbi:MAG: hypothetical protein BAJALOKI2v1_20013 [Promethearchaeota archaeon]|nr:MAG: hypothetical protein BAJALOKI2v1_20013 [Candidatus Lokiarchaeota archaeon]